MSLEEGTVAVTAQLDRWKLGETPSLKILKSETGYRTIDLHPALVNVLKERRKDAFAKGFDRDDRFVFCTEDGRPLLQRNTSRDIEAAAKKAGLNGEGSAQCQLTCSDTPSRPG